MEPQVERCIDTIYRDPLDLVWIATAARVGIGIRRSREVFASWDGQGTLTLGAPEGLDPDDSLAQLVFHELCHALVEGPEAFGTPDWGLCNSDRRDLAREHACHRLQAALADRHGLRWFLAPTTDHRPYYDALGSDPLEEAPESGATESDASLAPARAGWQRATAGPWAAALDEALAATAQIAGIVRPFVTDCLWSRAEPTP